MSIALRLFVDPEDGDPGTAAPAVPPPADLGPTVAAAIAAYLPHAERSLSLRAFQEAKRLLEQFCTTHGPRLLADCVPADLETWAESNPAWKSDWTLKRVIASVQRAFNWNEKKRHLANPFRGVTHCAGERGRPMTPKEFSSMLRRTDPCFRRVLIFLRFTGARPGEMAGLEPEQVDRARGVAVLGVRKHKTGKKTGRPRVIALHPVVLKLLAWIERKQWWGGKVFTNSRRRPWTRSSLALRMGRLRQRCKIARDCKLYGLRHKFGTDGVLTGVDLATIAELMGHASTRMTEHYVHLAGKTEHLAAAVARIAGGGPGPRQG